MAHTRYLRQRGHREQSFQVYGLRPPRCSCKKHNNDTKYGAHVTSHNIFPLQIPDQDSARRAKPGDPFTLTVDASKTGWGEVAIDVVYDNKSIRRTFYVDEVSDRVYQVTFTPQARGKHRVFVYLNGMEVKGSAFSLRIGKDIKEARTTNRNEACKASTIMSGRYKKFEEQKEEKRASYAEKEVFIEKPVAPPREERKKTEL